MLCDTCRDAHLEMLDQKIQSMTGTLHFIKFDTCRMEGFMSMVAENDLVHIAKCVSATGGGAYKFEKDFKEAS